MQPALDTRSTDRRDAAENPQRSLRVPGPPWHALLRRLRGFERDPLRFLLAVQRQYGDLVRLNFGVTSGFFIAHPDQVRHVLHDRHSIYNKDTIDYRMLKPAVGEGLLTSDGELWLRQRRLMQPAFHRQRVAAFGALMVERAEAMLERWRAIADGDVLDMAVEMPRLTLDIATRALFGVDVLQEATDVAAAFTVLNRDVTEQFYSLLGWLRIRIGLPRRRARAALATLHRVVDAIIARRHARNEDGGDLLSMLLAARDADDGQGMSATQLRDEVLTLLLAGHETTANLLCWTWYLLSTHPLVRERLCTELAATVGGRAPTVDDLPRLPYARQVIDESLRLYPPAWGISRAPTEDDEISGYAIPAKSFVLLSAYVTHRHPDFWENPEGFDPERFTPERVAARPHFAYFPFGGGPRLCIGNGFALQEAVLVLATVAQHYRLDVLPGHAVEPEPLITLRPRGGLPMRARRLTD